MPARSASPSACGGGGLRLPALRDGGGRLHPARALFDGGAGCGPPLDARQLPRALRPLPRRAVVRQRLLVAALTTVLSVAVNLLAGYALAKLRFRGRGLVFVLVLSTLMVPPRPS